ncbi:transcriptional regulator, PucR family protein [Streptomyces sp. ERV7]|uniref:PucR family transcriptional regulator n=1 Tax=Streptomyces sp. ERV7 TaxID=1322334 RepID=UPI0007F3B85F|nr:PucR family transcriptional regulator [Streptomyces sp. ERV7]OAR22936.1 transcriptional regulator, PucR family protein [Streptomyces sp. ERV7]
MHVGHLLQLDSLDLTLLWGEAPLLGREISGVTATDLEDPARFLQEGEVVLSGLVWWSPGQDRAKTDRFVSALRTSGAIALLAGEETHGTIPDELIDSCRAHRVPLLAVPARTSFRAITEAVYLRQWGDLSRLPAPHYVLPENVRTELSRLLDRGADPDELLDRALAPLGGPPCYLLTSSGRTVARTPSAPALSADRASLDIRGAAGTTLRIQTEGGSPTPYGPFTPYTPYTPCNPCNPYDAWHLHLPPGTAEVPPRVLHEIAEVLAQSRHDHDRRRAAERQAADELVTAIAAGAATRTGGGSDAKAMEGALRACGLPTEGPYRVLVATLGGTEGQSGAADALTEALSHTAATTFAVGISTGVRGAGTGGGEAVAIVQEPEGMEDSGHQLTDAWPLLAVCLPGAPLHAGASAPTDAAGLGAALVQARYALAAARTTSPGTARVTAVEDLSTLESLLAGVPTDVRAAYCARTLGPLTRTDSASHATLLETLEVFLAHNCSWARTAEALHLHVNTVHYRIERVEVLTGRDLSRLDHKLDLRAALLCR